MVSHRIMASIDVRSTDETRGRYSHVTAHSAAVLWREGADGSVPLPPSQRSRLYEMKFGDSNWTSQMKIYLVIICWFHVRNINPILGPIPTKFFR